MARQLKVNNVLLQNDCLKSLRSGELNEYKGIAIQLLEQYDSVQLLSAAMKLLTGDKKDSRFI